MNSLATVSASGTKPPGLPRRSNTIFVMPLSRWALIAASSCFAPSLENPDRLT